MQSKLLLAATAATGAMAVRDLSGALPEQLRRAELAARDQTECLAVYAKHSTLLDDFPEAPTALATATDIPIPTLTDPCVFPTITGPVGAVITSYSSALQSWQDAHITELRSLYFACSDVPQFSQVIQQYSAVICSTALDVITSTGASNGTATATGTATSGATGAGETTAAPTGTDASASDAAATSSSFNAAPKETGFVVAAAAAAAGIVGAVML
ncbi:uncharacterized protein CTRU02_212404 [Colletotrichum truncatum]|uniref:Uncharacterized protein n=1 Tax=Colletotrichum truncatum TaxID=5467 RepID=A0ACC3YP10_COLTU|nr:uncharacterized protein CTRU02_08724 [Colletotrichum truncatum]KAF6789477.1 hypothetical protein CTRU02_08724 [Colletotrichum truncatum]